MPTALFQDGLLEDGLALPRVYHVIDFSLCGFFARYNVRSSLYHFPAQNSTSECCYARPGMCVTAKRALCCR